VTIAFKRYLIVGSLFSAVALAGCGVSQSDYDALKTQNQQLQQQLDAQSKELADAKAQITRLAQKLASTQQNKLVVNGYTDNTPVGPGLQRQGITSNDILSQKRAEDVMQYMISQGVKSDLISAHGYGDADPVASNDTPKGRAQNRRVEITLAPEGS